MFFSDEGYISSERNVEQLASKPIKVSLKSYTQFLGCRSAELSMLFQSLKPAGMKTFNLAIDLPPPPPPQEYVLTKRQGSRNEAHIINAVYSTKERKSDKEIFEIKNEHIHVYSNILNGRKNMKIKRDPKNKLKYLKR